MRNHEIGAPIGTSVQVLEECLLESLIQPDMVLEGGHYVVGEPLDPVCVWSWKMAVELYVQAMHRSMHNIGLMLLVEDFAVPTLERDRYRACYQMPAEFRKILDRYRVDYNSVIVTWEVQLRNRAHGDLRRRLKPRVTWQEDGYFASANGGAQRRITRGTTPVCNFIMARYIAEKDRRYKKSLNIYDIKWECQSGGGVAVSRSIYDTQIAVFNAYVTSAEKIGFIVRHQEG